MSESIAPSVCMLSSRQERMWMNNWVGSFRALFLSLGYPYGLVTSIAGCVMRCEPAEELWVNLCCSLPLCEKGNVLLPFLMEYFEMYRWSELHKTPMLLSGIALGVSNCTSLKSGSSNASKGPVINQSLLLVNNLARQLKTLPFLHGTMWH